MDPLAIEDLEIRLLIQGIKERYGYDFEGYSKASFRRRLGEFQRKEDVSHLSLLLPRILYEPAYFYFFLNEISVSVTGMFRDPTFFLALRNQIAPVLRTYPYLKIWIAGCSTGEEAYSVAILLREEKLFDRAHVYATDIDPVALEKAQEGIYPLNSMKTYTTNYQKSGGHEAFSHYYRARYEHAIMDRSLKERLIFGRHNLVTDSSIGEMQLILCRNVMIYFTLPLQEYVLSKFQESLVHGGFLCLGTKEHLKGTQAQACFSRFGPEKIFQKKGA